MTTNRQIKNKELYKENNRLIVLNGNLKMAQSELIKSINECALLELQKVTKPNLWNKLKEGVAMANFKKVLRSYFDVYGDKVLCEEHIAELRDWQPILESEDKR